MEPLNDDELQQLIPSWKAPGTPDGMHSRIFGTRRSRWAWLMTGAVRVPVPVCAAIVLVLLWLVSARMTGDVSDVPGGSSERQTVVWLADFQTPAEVQVRVVGEIK